MYLVYKTPFIIISAIIVETFALTDLFETILINKSFYERLKRVLPMYNKSLV